MSGVVLVDRRGTVLFRLAWLVSPLLVVAAVGVAVGLLRYAASDAPAWPGLVLLLLALLAGLLPDTGLGLAVLGGYGAWWAVAVDEPTTPWALPAALALLAAHAVLAHASAGPGDQVCGPTTRITWLRDVALVALATCSVAAVAALAGGVETSELAAGAGLLLLAGLVWVVWSEPTD